LTRFVRDGEAASAAGRNGAVPASNTSSIERRILEVGPGTGAVTLQIIADMRPNDRLVLVERNQEFVEHLGQRLREIPEFESRRDRILLKHASVEEMPANETYDLIISGLPLNNFEVDLVERILSKLSRLLAPGGILSFFEYVAVRRAKALVSSPNDRVRLEGITRVLGDFLAGMEIRRDLVLANVPPAWVHHVRFGGIALEAPR
jgi:phospholipid N-methyltransferase